MFKLIAIFGLLAVCLSQYCQTTAFSTSASLGFVTGIFYFNLSDIADF